MISPRELFDQFAAHGVSFISGVPDSLLREFCAYVDAILPSDRHIITANEGTAIGVAAGMHLATGSIPLVYFQNSGIGNAINPLLSLCDPDVYGIPLILLVGWRGRPGRDDEPQHKKQGRILTDLLRSLELPFQELAGDVVQYEDIVRWAVETARERSGPVAILVHENTFSVAGLTRKYVSTPELSLTREDAIGLILDVIGDDGPLISTTGMISREVYAQRRRRGQAACEDFLTIGSMGHASQIALGLSLCKPEVPVTCLDGDGALLMHMGGMATIGAAGAGRFLHIVLNNEGKAITENYYDIHLSSHYLIDK